MRVGLTGSTGSVGHWIAADLMDAGHAVVALDRRRPSLPVTEYRPFALDGAAPDLSGLDALVHAAFSHVPGRYRGGEGDDPLGFRRLNLDGTRRLFDGARAAGLCRVVFLSSRAVYGDYPPGTPLTEALAPRPDTLYGQVKNDAEQYLAGMSSDFESISSLRATGVYGPPVAGRRHKWQDLLDAFARGEPQAARAGTEVHALDLAAAVRLMLTLPAARLSQGVWNVSDIALDRRALLEAWSRLTGIAGPLPPAADPSSVSAMSTDRLRALGWRPRGPSGVGAVLRSLAAGA